MSTNGSETCRSDSASAVQRMEEILEEHRKDGVTHMQSFYIGAPFVPEEEYASLFVYAHDGSDENQPVDLSKVLY